MHSAGHGISRWMIHPHLAKCSRGVFCLFEKSVFNGLMELVLSSPSAEKYLVSKMYQNVPKNVYLCRVGCRNHDYHSRRQRVLVLPGCFFTFLRCGLFPVIVILPARIKSQKWVCPQRMHPSPGPCIRPWPAPSRHFNRAIANHSKGITQRCNRLYEGGTVNPIFWAKSQGNFSWEGGRARADWCASRF